MSIMWQSPVGIINTSFLLSTGAPTRLYFVTRLLMICMRGVKPGTKTTDIIITFIQKGPITYFST